MAMMNECLFSMLHFSINGVANVGKKDDATKKDTEKIPAAPSLWRLFHFFFAEMWIFLKLVVYLQRIDSTQKNT